jgi:hypothetical protein
MGMPRKHVSLPCVYASLFHLYPSLLYMSSFEHTHIFLIKKYKGEVADSSPALPALPLARLAHGPVC